jgi:hypothetical protein
MSIHRTLGTTLAAATVLMAPLSAASPNTHTAPRAIEREVAAREVTLPAGTLLPLTLDSGVASDTSRVEDAVRAHLRRPLVVDGIQVLPAGARVAGFVSEAQRSARVKGRARVAFRFTSLMHDGEHYGLRTSRVVREAPGTKKRDALTIGVPAGAGAAIGAITGGRKGAAIGSAIGGGAGTGAVLSTRGREVRVGRGTAVGVRLLAPVTILVDRR